MSELRLEDMPDEILMKVLSNLDIYGNMDCQERKLDRFLAKIEKEIIVFCSFDTVNRHTWHRLLMAYDIGLAPAIVKII